MNAVIFDLDDTLFDDTACTHAGLKALAQAYATANWSYEQFFSRHAQIIQDIDPLLFTGQINAHQARVLRFERLLSECGVANPDGEAATQTYRAAYKASWSAISGAAEMLSTLRARGLRIAVLTNYVREVQAEKLAHCGLLPLVDHVLCIEDVPAAKPDPRAYHAACQRLGSLSAQTLMVGDNWENDVQGALRAGLSAVWFNRHAKPSPDASVPEISELAMLMVNG